jgi:hypothetical protein
MVDMRTAGVSPAQIRHLKIILSAVFTSCWRCGNAAQRTTTARYPELDELPALRSVPHVS